MSPMDMRQPSEKLRESVILSIRKSEYRRARFFLAISTVTFSASIVGFVIATQYLLQAFFGSEFYSYATLVFSDPNMAVVFWKDITLSLVESLPVAALALSLVALVAVLASARVMAFNIKAAFTPSFTV